MEGEFQVPIYYEDTDFTGYVYHANFLKFFERAREELFGREQLRKLYLEGKHFVVKDAQLSFHKPVRHGDVITIKSKIVFDHPAVVTCHHTACLNENGVTSTHVTGLVRLVSVNERGHPTRLPVDSFGRSGDQKA